MSHVRKDIRLRFRYNGVREDTTYRGIRSLRLHAARAHYLLHIDETSVGSFRSRYYLAVRAYNVAQRVHHGYNRDLYAVQRIGRHAERSFRRVVLPEQFAYRGACGGACRAASEIIPDCCFRRLVARFDVGESEVFVFEIVYRSPYHYRHFVFPRVIPDSFFVQLPHYARSRLQPECGASRQYDGVHFFDRFFGVEKIRFPCRGSATPNRYAAGCALVADYRRDARSAFFVRIMSYPETSEHTFSSLCGAHAP